MKNTVKTYKIQAIKNENIMAYVEGNNNALETVFVKTIANEEKAQAIALTALNSEKNNKKIKTLLTIIPRT